MHEHAVCGEFKWHCRGMLAILVTGPEGASLRQFEYVKEAVGWWVIQRPDPNVPIAAAGHNKLSLFGWPQANQLGPLPSAPALDLPTGVGVPHFDCSALPCRFHLVHGPTTRQQLSPIGQKEDTLDDAIVSRDSADFLACGQIPKPHAPVESTRGQHPAIRPEADGSNRSSVARQLVQ